MNTAATTLALLLACATPWSSAADVQRRVDADRDFSLRIGESVRSSDNGTQIGLLGVDTDSRCRKGEQCISAGNATVRVWLQQGSGPRTVRTLHTAAGPEQAAQVHGQELTLLRLEPLAVAGRAIAPADYVATLVWRPAADGETQR